MILETPLYTYFSTGNGSYINILTIYSFLPSTSLWIQPLTYNSQLLDTSFEYFHQTNKKKKNLSSENGYSYKMSNSYPPLAERPIPNTIVLFDVDGTLTPARRVSLTFF